MNISLHVLSLHTNNVIYFILTMQVQSLKVAFSTFSLITYLFYFIITMQVQFLIMFPGESCPRMCKELLSYEY